LKGPPVRRLAWVGGSFLALTGVSGVLIFERDREYAPAPNVPPLGASASALATHDANRVLVGDEVGMLHVFEL
jgi:hypothetical protein